ncbi:MAG TPA: hypothetical protein VEQ42_05930 [Pyrinomonadaceae bacterium]|nr:hypothetical protein [Pyrinomonadaceae bacterium]
MEELIRQVSERAGIDEGKARAAVETVVGFLKDKLPAPVAGQLDGVLGGASGGGGLADQAGNLMGGLGGMFGNKE